MAHRIRAEATTAGTTPAVERFEGRCGRFDRGHGTIVDQGLVRVGDEVIRADRGIVLSTGTSAAIPDRWLRRHPVLDEPSSDRGRGAARLDRRGLLALAVHAEVPVAQLQTMIDAYPTFHRGIEDAVNQLDLG